MNSTLRNILAVILGLVIGSIVNGAIIQISGSIIPPPEGADLKTMEGLKASMHLFTPINFLMPWLAHALGTFIGALVAALIAANNKMRFAIAIGCVFLIGGIMAVYMLPAPMWFNIVDLALAYIPMGWLAGKMATRNR
ncbi:MAG: hypothetical protein KA347_08140 [Bacteroidia bacterium]|nr:hypothetical protein [Bacteroidota bacterium]MBP6512623.1 hypothetical protein [Bacteroidia bacterium]MBP7245147.1 hypothetical protein [Bacteroidia bacterium]